VSLGLRIKLINFLRVVYFLSVDLCISQNHSFPDRFVRLFKVDIQKLRVLDRPEAVFHLYFFAKFTVDNRLGLAFNKYLQVFRFNLNEYLAGSRAFRYWNLNIYIANRLRPDVSLSFTSVVSANSLVNFFFRLLRLRDLFFWRRLLLYFLLLALLLFWLCSFKLHFFRDFFIFLFLFFFRFLLSFFSSVPAGFELCTLGWELFFVFILILFEKLVDLNV